MADATDARKHLRLPAPSGPQPYQAKAGGGTKTSLLPRDVVAHAAALLQQLDSALAAVPAGAPAHYVTAALAGGAAKDAAYSLATQGATLASLTESPDGLRATVVVPADKAGRWLRSKLDDYATRKTQKGQPRNEKLAASLESLKVASVADLFTGNDNEFPAAGQPAWWQAWVRKGSESVLRSMAQALGILVATEQLPFPDESVLLIHATPDNIQVLINRTGTILELRPPEIPGLLALPPGEEHAVLRQLHRTINAGPTAVAVCLLDAGVFRSQPLLENSITQADLHAYDPSWSLDDLSAQTGYQKHGTAMAGLALYGDLLELFSGTSNVDLRHCLESVKILPDNGQNPERLYGAITVESMARPEVSAPDRRRVFCLAVTAQESTDGSPSAWSAAIDDACFNDGINTRLIVVSAGNIAPGPNYPDTNDTSAIQDPAQSWNALTVGACTQKIDTKDQGWSPVASSGTLAPPSRTSVRWINRPESPPIKPDVVFEGGNWATDGQVVDPRDALQLLTTSAGTAQSKIRVFGDTSAATALAARCAARIWSANPKLWPETVRGLIAHSATWTDAISDPPVSTQSAREQILRRVGYGAPDEQRARESLFNHVTLISEHEIQPFTEDAKTGGLILYELPWPVERLQEIADLEVELRVTLSYFIQPKPGRRGGKGKYSYPSHQLRFELKKASESPERFASRINKLADRVDSSGSEASEPWLYGQKRDCGSLHSDTWSGRAGDLAKRNLLAVFPAAGWWKVSNDRTVRPQNARFALIVSLRARSLTLAQIDLYNEIKTVIQVAAQAETQIEI